MISMYLILVGVTQDESPLLHLGAQIIWRICLHPIALYAAWRETCKKMLLLSANLAELLHIKDALVKDDSVLSKQALQLQ